MGVAAGQPLREPAARSTLRARAGAAARLRRRPRAARGGVESLTGVGAPRLSLKWPNDLLLDGAKLAGLLLEGHRIDAGRAARHRHRLRRQCRSSRRPARPTRRPTLRGSSAADARRRGCLRGAVRRVSPGPSPPGAMARGRRPILSARSARLWLERAAGIGRRVTVRLPLGRATRHLRGARRRRAPAAAERRRPGTDRCGRPLFSHLLHDTAGHSPSTSKALIE